MQFPPELLYNIVKYTNLNEIIKVCMSLCPGIDSKTLQSIILDRKDTKYIFKDICLDVPNLLNAMVRSGAILSGLRAKNHFDTISISDDTPWEFYCHNHPLSCIRFIAYLESIGVIWMGRCNSVNYSIPNYKHYTLLGYIKVQENKIRDIYVYWPMKYVLYTDPKCLLRYIGKDIHSRTYTIWGNMTMILYKVKTSEPTMSTESIVRTSPLFKKYYWIDYNNKCTTLSTVRLGLTNSEPYNMDENEINMYTNVQILASNFNLINIVTAIYPHTQRFQPEYLSDQSWFQILEAIIRDSKLFLFI